MAYSKQRESILRAVQASKRHPTADDIYAALKPEHPGLSLGTVYRNLNLLAGAGKIKKLSLPDSADRFDGELKAHWHLQCRYCGGVVDMPEPSFVEELIRVVPPKGCEIHGMNLIFYGKCSLCTDAPRAETTA